MLSLSQCIVLSWHGHQHMVGAILVSSWSPSHLLRTLELEVGHSWKHRSQLGCDARSANKVEADSYMILHAEKSIQKNTGALESKLELHQLSAEASATSAQLAARTGWSQRTEVA